MWPPVSGSWKPRRAAAAAAAADELTECCCWRLERLSRLSARLKLPGCEDWEVVIIPGCCRRLGFWAGYGREVGIPKIK